MRLGGKRKSSAKGRGSSFAPTALVFCLVLARVCRYPFESMKRSGTYKLANRSPEPAASYLDPLGNGLGRHQRIVDSLRCQILEGGPEQSLRIRQVFSTPREIYRVEIQETALNYSRTTLLDRDALEDLLETDGVRERILEVAEA